MTVVEALEKLTNGVENLANFLKELEGRIEALEDQEKSDASGTEVQ